MKVKKIVEQRKFTDLTKDEVRQIVQDIFEPKRITNIKVSKTYDEITCNIYTEWGDDAELVCDELTLKNPFDYGEDAIIVDFQVNRDDYMKLKQFCYAKGIYGVAIEWMFDNPYIEKEAQ